MSDNSERESQSSPSPHTFSGEEFESGSHNEDLGTDGERTGFERVVEGLIVEGSRVGGEKQSRSSGGEAYKEMQRNYVTLEACANQVLGITQAPEASASGRAGPSGCGTVVVASADVGIPIRVPLPKKNMMSLYDLESLKVDYAILECVGLRLPIPAEVARYPPEGCVMVFSAMSLCLPVSKEEEEEIELVKRLVPQEARELKNIVTPALLLQLRLLQGMAEMSKKVVTVAEDSPKVVVDPEERQRKL
ncbi:unnamed protein product [Prunus armeniaca]